MVEEEGVEEEKEEIKDKYDEDIMRDIIKNQLYLIHALISLL